MPFLNYVFYPWNGWVTLSLFCIGALVVFMHRENIKRLMEGKESKLSFKKTDKHAANDHNGGAEASTATEAAPEKEYKDSDFVNCACGRLIPVSRKTCVYCGAENKKYIPRIEETSGKKKKKK